MKPHATRDAQAGFSLIELMVTMGIMVAILGVTAGLMADALRNATVMSETTEAQQSLRSAHEYLNRDLIIAGDGLGGLGTSKVMLPVGFVTSNITPAPNDQRVFVRPVGTNNPYVAHPLIASDDAQSRSTAAAGVLASSDRLTMMTIQPDTGFPVGVAAGAASYGRPNANTLIANMSAATAALFKPGEVVLVSSTAGGTTTSTFAAVSGVTTAPGGQLRFAAGDAYGLNQANLPLLLGVVCGATMNPGIDACNSITIQRVLLITYFVDPNGLLRRRVLGKPRRGTITEAAFTAAAMAGDVVAEHITEFDASYGLIAPDRTGWEIVDQMNINQEPRVRQIEVKMTAETPHPIKKDGEHATATSVVRTSVRTMEYRTAL